MIELLTVLLALSLFTRSYFSISYHLFQIIFFNLYLIFYHWNFNSNTVQFIFLVCYYWIQIFVRYLSSKHYFFHFMQKILFVCNNSILDIVLYLLIPNYLIILNFLQIIIMNQLFSIHFFYQCFDSSQGFYFYNFQMIIDIF